MGMGMDQVKDGIEKIQAHKRRFAIRRRTHRRNTSTGSTTFTDGESDSDDEQHSEFCGSGEWADRGVSPGVMGLEKDVCAGAGRGGNCPTRRRTWQLFLEPFLDSFPFLFGRCLDPPSERPTLTKLVEQTRSVLTHVLA